MKSIKITVSWALKTDCHSLLTPNSLLLFWLHLFFTEDQFYIKIDFHAGGTRKAYESLEKKLHESNDHELSKNLNIEVFLKIKP